MSDAMMP